MLLIRSLKQSFFLILKLSLFMRYVNCVDGHESPELDLELKLGQPGSTDRTVNRERLNLEHNLENQVIPFQQLPDPSHGHIQQEYVPVPFRKRRGRPPKQDKKPRKRRRNVDMTEEELKRKRAFNRVNMKRYVERKKSDPKTKEDFLTRRNNTSRRYYQRVIQDDHKRELLKLKQKLYRESRKGGREPKSPQ